MFGPLLTLWTVDARPEIDLQQTHCRWRQLVFVDIQKNGQWANISWHIFFLWFSCIIKNLLTKSTTTPKRRYACIGTIVGLKHSSRVQGHFSLNDVLGKNGCNEYSTLKWSQSTWNKNFLLVMIGFLKYPTFLWFEIHVQKFYSHSWNNKSLCNTVYQRKTYCKMLVQN